MALNRRETLTAELVAMLSTRRPAGSRSEHRFIAQYLTPLGLEQDNYGNLYKRIGDAPVLWSSHTDTVHRTGGTQAVSHDGKMIRLHGKEKQSNCLGADCGSGIWLMMQMIRAKKPGLYVFHKDEEYGGFGSQELASGQPDLLDGIDMAIAFDRRGKTSVVTHQAGGRCCSDTFAQVLSAQLGHNFTPDSGGIFTDTANYVDLIPECTNISVGYSGEHTKHETQDIAHLFKLLGTILALDTGKLPIDRIPGEDADDDRWPRVISGGWNDLDANDWEPMSRSKRTMSQLVRDHPDEIADWLDQYGVDVCEVEDMILQAGGALRKYA